MVHYSKQLPNNSPNSERGKFAVVQCCGVVAELHSRAQQGIADRKRGLW